eukprot:s326_g40.t1
MAFLDVATQVCGAVLQRRRGERPDRRAVTLCRLDQCMYGLVDERSGGALPKKAEQWPEELCFKILSGAMEAMKSQVMQATIRMLKASAADKAVIDAAFRCAVCVEQRSEEMPRVVTPTKEPRKRQFNYEVSADVFEVRDATGARRSILSLVDLATHRHIAVKVGTDLNSIANQDMEENMGVHQGLIDQEEEPEKSPQEVFMMKLLISAKEAVIQVDTVDSQGHAEETSAATMSEESSPFWWQTACRPASTEEIYKKQILELRPSSIRRRELVVGPEMDVDCIPFSDDADHARHLRPRYGGQAPFVDVVDSLPIHNAAALPDASGAAAFPGADLSDSALLAAPAAPSPPP